MNIFRIRKSKQWSQNDLAAKCGIPASVISNYECGVRTPSLNSMRKLKHAFGCSWDELLDKPKKL